MARFVGIGHTFSCVIKSVARPSAPQRFAAIASMTHERHPWLAFVHTLIMGYAARLWTISQRFGMVVEALKPRNILTSQWETGVFNRFSAVCTNEGACRSKGRSFKLR